MIVREATAEDAGFLYEVVAIAVDWRPGAIVRSAAAVMSDPALAHYVGGWPRPGDVGFVAVEERKIGAAWWRTFPANDPGYGFVDPSTPEVSVGVLAGSRGDGVGTLLLETLIAEGRRRDVPALSLSVEVENPALRLYERLGFVAVHRAGGALTMVLDLRT